MLWENDIIISINKYNRKEKIIMDPMIEKMFNDNLLNFKIIVELVDYLRVKYGEEPSFTLKALASWGGEVSETINHPLCGCETKVKQLKNHPFLIK